MIKIFAFAFLISFQLFSATLLCGTEEKTSDVGKETCTKFHLQDSLLTCCWSTYRKKADNLQYYDCTEMSTDEAIFSLTVNAYKELYTDVDFYCTSRVLTYSLILMLFIIFF